MSANRTIGGINVTISASVEKFNRSINASRRMMNSFAKTAAKATFSVKGFVAAAASGLAARSLTRLTSGAMQTIDAQAKLADKFGISTEKLAGFELAASEAGVSIGELDKYLSRLTAKTGKAADEVFLGLVDRVSGMSSKQAQLNATIEAFGAKGGKMVSVLRLGRAGLAEAQSAAVALGLAIDRKTAAGVERANDAFGRFKLAISGAQRPLAVELAPSIEAVSNKMVGLMSKTGAAKSFGSVMADAVVKAMKFVADGVQKMVGAVMTLVANIQAMVHKFRGSVVGASMGLGYRGPDEYMAGWARSRVAQDRADQHRRSPPWSKVIQDTVDAVQRQQANQGGGIAAVAGGLVERMRTSNLARNAANAMEQLAKIPGAARAGGSNLLWDAFMGRFFGKLQ
ncbi:MAG TPA: hypothetical protein PKC18_21490, partial [Lacipirellulaceae bacterium]|nr:hypothetical protein [Lacipirellulaceae bacterium]